MSLERRDNDQVVEETKKEAAEVERKVRAALASCFLAYTPTQMAEHLRQNEDELAKLLAEYWRLRHQTGKLNTLVLTMAYSGLLKRSTWRPSLTS